MSTRSNFITTAMLSIRTRVYDRSGALFFLLWSTLATCSTIATKFLFDAFDFTFPTFVTACQSGATALVLVVFLILRSRKRKVLSRLPPTNFAVSLALVAAATLILDNLSLTYNNYGTYFFYTSLGLPMFSLLRWLFLGEGNNFSVNMVFIFLLLSVIAIVATDFDINAKGIRYGLLSSFSSSLHRIILLRWVRYKMCRSPLPRGSADHATNSSVQSMRSAHDDGFSGDSRGSCLSSLSDVHLRSSRSTSPSNVPPVAATGEGKYSPGTPVSSAFISVEEGAVLACLQMCVTALISTVCFPLIDSYLSLDYPVTLSRKALMLSVLLFFLTTIGSILLNCTFNFTVSKPNATPSYSQSIPASDACHTGDLNVSHTLPRSSNLLFYSPLVSQVHFFPFPSVSVGTHASHVVLLQESKRGGGGGGDKYDRSGSVAVAYTKGPRFTLLFIEVVRCTAVILTGLWGLCVSFQMNNFGFQLVALGSLAFYMLMRCDIGLINDLTGLPGTARWGKSHGASGNDDDNVDMVGVNAARKRKDNAV